MTIDGFTTAITGDPKEKNFDVLVCRDQRRWGKLTQHPTVQQHSCFGWDSER